MSEAKLDAALLAAHAAGDRGRLIQGYEQAADLAEAAGEVDRACFFLTQAWVFALEAGDARANGLKARLTGHGREKVE